MYTCFNILLHGAVRRNECVKIIQIVKKHSHPGARGMRVSGVSFFL